MNNGISIRNATENDFEPIYSFVCALKAKHFDRAMMRDIYQNNIRIPDNIYLVAETKGAPAGFLSCHCQHLLHHGGLIGEIQEMFILEEYRSKGIGKLLIQDLLEKAKRLKVMQVEVVSNRSRPKAHAFYLKEGFEETSKKFVIRL